MDDPEKQEIILVKIGDFLSHGTSNKLYLEKQ